MQLQTKVDLRPFHLEINEYSKLLFLGSCFAEKIGLHFIQNQFICKVNPFGVLYNPLSISLAIQTALERNYIKEEMLFEYDGIWASWQHSTLFSNVSREKCIEKINQELSTTHQLIQEADFLFITFGTNKYYQIKGTNTIVSNCHKMPASLFEEKEANIEEIVKEWQDTLKKLLNVNPKIKIVFTVSPYRYAAYGLHQSQLAKATLLLAIDELQKLFGDSIHYFPAYEIVSDELRDYRFYAEDMLHPSETAVKYIWDCFTESALTASAIEYLKEWENIQNALNHKPRHPESSQYKKFQESTQEKYKEFLKKYKRTDIII